MGNKRKRVVFSHRGRLFQIPIYLGKFLRGFVYMSDWKMLPMSAVIAALVCMVVRRTFFVSMDGTLKGSFSFCCVAIWNGCFNSIQVICRERPIVKREHRSGMHISSYIAAHMIYQALLCAGQTVILIYVSSLCGVKFPKTSFITSSFKLDIGITLFLIAYASDMLSLLISAFAHTTTAAMTVMPFILIFQLVFSGGFFQLPAWASNFSAITISNYGLKAINAQADYNHLPMTAAWTALTRLENDEITGTFTIGELMDIAGDDEGLLKQIRSSVIDLDKVESTAENAIESAVVSEESTVAAASAENEIDAADENETVPAEIDAETAAESETEVPAQTDTKNQIKVGQIIDAVIDNDIAQSYRNYVVPYSINIKEIIDAIGRDKLENNIMMRSAAAMADPVYDRTVDNIASYWTILGAFALMYALLAMILLEFIDKDKR